MKTIVKKALALALLVGLSSSAMAAVIATPTPKPIKKFSQLHLIDVRLRNAYVGIGHSVKAKQMTASEAETLKSQLKTIRQQLFTFLKQDKAAVAPGTKVDLTVSQATQLNQSLDPITQQIPVK